MWLVVEDAEIGRATDTGGTQWLLSADGTWRPENTATLMPFSERTLKQKTDLERSA
jgi:hypothetical protein